MIEVIDVVKYTFSGKMKSVMKFSVGFNPWPFTRYAGGLAVGRLRCLVFWISSESAGKPLLLASQNRYYMSFIDDQLNIEICRTAVGGENLVSRS